MWPLLLQTALAIEAAPFDCCHHQPPTEAMESLHILVVPPADRRPFLTAPGANPDHAHRMGQVRGGYGNPFTFRSPHTVAEHLTAILKDHCQKLGHTVEVGTGPVPGQPALTADALDLTTHDVVIHGSISQFEVDISAYNTFKITLRGALTLYVDGEATRQPIEIEHQEGAGGLGVRDLKRLAKQWYGKKRPKYVMAAAVEHALITFAEDQLTRGRPAEALLHAGRP